MYFLFLALLVYYLWTRWKHTVLPGLPVIEIKHVSRPMDPVKWQASSKIKSLHYACTLKMWISAFGQFFKFLICIHASITSPCGRCSAVWLRMYSYQLIKRPVEQRLCTCTNNMSTININGNLAGSEHIMWKWSAKERGLRTSTYHWLIQWKWIKYILILDTYYLIAVTLEKSFTMSDF